MGPLGKSLGMGKKPMMGMDEEEGDYADPMADPMAEEPTEEPEGDVPPDFAAQYEEFSAAPSAKGLYDLIKASAEGGGSSSKPDLALILGGKGRQ